MAQYDVQRKATEQKNSGNSSARTVQLKHNNVESIIQMAKMNPEMLTQNDVMVLQKTMGNGAVRQLIKGAGDKQKGAIQKKDGKLEENESIQTKKENNTGLPDNLKAGVESLSGLSMDDVRVHYNSDKPVQMGALAYAQGTDIHVAPGQEKHLPHEAWHVVQQAQGRVQATTQMKGVAVNADVGLEREADVMGEKSMEQNINNEVNYNRIQQIKKSEIINKDSIQMYMSATATISGQDSEFSAQGFSGDSKDYEGIKKELSNKFSQIMPGNHTEEQIHEDATKKLSGKIKEQRDKEWSEKYEGRENEKRERTQCAEPHALIEVLGEIDRTVNLQEDTIKISNINEGGEKRKPCLTCKDWVTDPDADVHGVKNIEGLITFANEKLPEKSAKWQRDAEIRESQKRMNEDERTRAEEARKKDPTGLLRALEFEAEITEFLNIKEFREFCTDLAEKIGYFQTQLSQAELNLKDKIGKLNLRDIGKNKDVLDEVKKKIRDEILELDVMKKKYDDGGLTLDYYERDYEEAKKEFCDKFIKEINAMDGIDTVRDGVVKKI